MNGMITGAGVSQKTIEGQVSAENLYNKYADEKQLPHFRQTPKEDLLKEEFFQRFSYWATFDYKSPMTKDHLALGSILGYVGKIFTIAKDQLFKKDPFFVGVSEDSNNWYTAMRAGIERIVVSRCIDNGESISEKPPSLSRSQMLALLNELWIHATPDAFLRVCILATTYCSFGRSSDIQVATLNLYRWDHTLQIGGYAINSPKTGKDKPIGYVHDSNYRMDHYVCMAVNLMMGNGQASFQQHDCNNHWVFDGLQVKESSAKISGYLENLTPSSKSVEYKDRNVPCLPDNIVAGSLRQGSLNELTAGNVPHTITTLAGGHEESEPSNYILYQIASFSSIMPGTIQA